MELKRVPFTGNSCDEFRCTEKAIPDESCFKLMLGVHGEVVRRLHNPQQELSEGESFSCLYNQSGLCRQFSVETSLERYNSFFRFENKIFH